MSLAVAILAGGLATRMLPFTEKSPKSLINVAGDYFICHQLRYLKQQGITKVVLCVGHLGEQIEAVVGSGKAFGLEVCYSWDGSELLGTGGALKKALPLLGKAFFILYGDSYLPIDFSDMETCFHKGDKPALMAVYKNKNKWDKSNVIFNKNQSVEYNKSEPKPEMEYIDYGLTILSALELKNFPAEGAFDLAELYQQLSQQGTLNGHEVFERFYEIGSMEGLSEVIERFRLVKI
ncbi:MAG: NTP transferase domain-containing protein [Tatlockia sp.]|nr:NTP transferase domain-containing protein [Tatlockia sp.]